MTEPKLRPFGAVRIPVFYRLGVICPRCGRVLRNEQGLAGHRRLKHGGGRHA
jgi:hypothetical protein